MTGDSNRQPLPDALRALALVAVLVVNTVGYAIAPLGPHLGLRLPPESTWAAATQGLVAGLLQGKGYTMLAFVFGMGLWLAARRHSRPDALQRGAARQGRLLLLGVLHGAFVYLGDILTMYAVVGWQVLGRLHMPWRRFRRHLRGAFLAAVLAKLLLAGVIFRLSDLPLVVEGASLSSVRNAWEFLGVNASTYALQQVSALIFSAPVLYFCMLCGVAAARLRLLTHRRWRGWLNRVWLLACVPVLALGGLHGWGYGMTPASQPVSRWLEVLGEWVSMPMAALYVVALALASRGGRARWCRWLGPLGQRTLSLYVGHSLICMALFSGVGLGLMWTTVQSVVFCLGLWVAAWAAAALSGPTRWPLEAWMARR
ncbi:DUF418 domain-containing protein [Hydrogenophaga sp.]|uniref:DUF418 domain-containing protein n=1 Tax=Hydrogenophaga sp. TaxID=1904254 RepID=UPI003F7169E5